MNLVILTQANREENMTHTKDEELAISRTEITKLNAQYLECAMRKPAAYFANRRPSNKEKKACSCQ